MAGPFVLSEKRALPRRELLFYLKVTDQDRKKEIGRMIDIHSKGLLVMSNNPLEVGKEFFLLIDTPKSLKARSITGIEIMAKCVWSKRSLTPPYMESGLMIVDKSPKAEEAINLLISLFAMPDASLRA
ncbi:MAG: hypothetical protein LBT47_04280 [Deltaproteobacteria bacterium]|jgi:hypothetical protein|nr:hypothetical protein [Deltaproteobacteria bacterium]